MLVHLCNILFYADSPLFVWWLKLWYNNIPLEPRPSLRLTLSPVFAVELNQKTLLKKLLQSVRPNKRVCSVAAKPAFRDE